MGSSSLSTRLSLAEELGSAAAGGIKACIYGRASQICLLGPSENWISWLPLVFAGVLL